LEKSAVLFGNLKISPTPMETKAFIGLVDYLFITQAEPCGVRFRHGVPG
jgi:hypothetical protein